MVTVNVDGTAFKCIYRLSKPKNHSSEFTGKPRTGPLSLPVLSSSAVLIHGLGEKVRIPYEPGEQAVVCLLAQLCSLKLVRWLSD